LLLAAIMIKAEKQSYGKSMLPFNDKMVENISAKKRSDDQA